MVSVLAYQLGLKRLRGSGVLRIGVEKAASASGLAKITVSQSRRSNQEIAVGGIGSRGQVAMRQIVANTGRKGSSANMTPSAQNVHYAPNSGHGIRGFSPLAVLLYWYRP
jgi:hypothetical protein